MDNKTITQILASQYKASLGMLQQVLEKVPMEQQRIQQSELANCLPYFMGSEILFGS